MSKYFSIDTIMAAFSVLNKELKTGTGFSALQYMFAFDNFVCKYGRDCDTGSDEDTFVSFAHKVGGLEDGEVPDHIADFTGKRPKKDKDSDRIHSNFISAGAVPRSERASREDPERYPSGKNYLFEISRKELLVDSICYEHLGSYLKSKEMKTAFAVWVERNSAFKDESSFAEALKDALGQSYTADLIDALWKDGAPSPDDIGLDDDAFSNVKPCIDWTTIEERFGVGEPNGTHSEPGRMNPARNSPEALKKVAGLSRNLIYYGAPGTGKSYQLNKLAKGSFAKKNIRRVTFYPDYTYSQFVGCFKPYSEPGSKEISYEFVEGPFLKTYLDAIAHPYDNFVLLIEEINRANPAAVFGDVFQLLDRDKSGNSVYSVAASKEMADCIGGYLDALKDDTDVRDDIERYYDPDIDFDDFSEMACEDLSLPPNMYIWATMNSADQGVFPMDTAFKRRWSFKYIGIDAGADKPLEDGRKISELEVPISINGINTLIVWDKLRRRINGLMKTLRINEDKFLGPFFISPNDLNDRFGDVFKDKVLLYLYEDIGKLKRGRLFSDEAATYFELCEQFTNDGVAIFKGIELADVAVDKMPKDVAAESEEEAEE